MTYSRDPFYGRYPWKKLRRQVRVAAGFRCSKALKHARALAYEPQNLMTCCAFTATTAKNQETERRSAVAILTATR